MLGISIGKGQVTLIFFLHLPLIIVFNQRDHVPQNLVIKNQFFKSTI